MARANHDVPTLRQWLGDRSPVVSVSGGKDSAAVCLYLKELEIEHTRVFADTGWEHRITYEYLRGELTAALGPIHEVSAGITLPDLCRKKGMFPSRTRRFCTSILKVEPIQAYLKGLEDDPVNVVGIRRAESQARSKLEEFEWNDTLDCEVWRPILHWTEADVIEIHQKHGLRPNPLYLQGARRVGCWPCIHAAKAEIRYIAETDPDRIEEIRQLETEVQTAAEARYAAKGETFESLGYHRPTFFQAAVPDAPGEKRGMWPIDEAVHWSKTAAGRRQLELFLPGDSGCVRWGMCDQAEPEED